MFRPPARSLLLLLLVPLMPIAGAMEVQVEGAPQAPLQPELESVPVTAVALIGCDEVLPYLDQTGRVTLDWTLTGVPQVLLAGAATTQVDAMACLTAPTSALRGENPITVAVTRDTVAFQDLPVKVGAEVNGGLSPLRAETTFFVQADAYVLVSAKVEERIVRADAGEQTRIPVAIETFGNAAVQVSVTTVDAPEGLQVVLPPALRLEAATGEDAETAATVEVAVTPAHAGDLVLRLRFTPSVVDDPSHTGEPADVTVVVRGTTLLGRATPGPGVAGILLLAGLAAARRR